MIKEIVRGRVKKIVVSYRDRLLRFGCEIIQQICNLLNVEIVTLHETPDKSFEYRLAQDVLTILTVYCSKTYGRRSHQR